jgi:hypothetical protein
MSARARLAAASRTNERGGCDVAKRISMGRAGTWWRWASAVAAAAVVAALAAAPAGALSIALAPATVTPEPGATFAVELRVAGLGDGAAPSLGAFDVTLAFDPAAVAFTSVSFDEFLGTIPAQALADFTPGAGTLALASFSLLPPATLDALQPGSFRLATIVFEAVGAGPSAIDVTSALLGDGFGGRLALSAAPTGVQVQPIPEPAAALVFGVCVAAVARASRQRRAAG